MVWITLTGLKAAARDTSPSLNGEFPTLIAKSAPVIVQT